MSPEAFRCRCSVSPAFLRHGEVLPAALEARAPADTEGRRRGGRAAVFRGQRGRDVPARGLLHGVLSFVFPGTGGRVRAVLWASDNTRRCCGGVGVNAYVPATCAPAGVSGRGGICLVLNDLYTLYSVHLDLVDKLLNTVAVKVSTDSTVATGTVVTQ